MKKIIFLSLGLLFFSAKTDQSSKEGSSPVKKYENAQIGFTFTYPANWLLVDNFEQGKIISLFTPDALQTKETTMDLVLGLKIEIYLLEKDEENERRKTIAKEKPCALLNKQGLALPQYCFESENCFIISTLLPVKNNAFYFIAYIPEKEKKNQYWAEYDKIILSFSSIKNSSP